MQNRVQSSHLTPDGNLAGVLRAVPPAGPSDVPAITQLMPRYSRPMSEDGPEGAELVPESPAGRVRQRAPRRAAGRRAQLTVPEDMWGEVARIAAQAGTTPNDVLVQLAAERLRDRRRRSELQARAEQRWQAFRAAIPAPEVSAQPLSESELLALSRTMREDA
ncbi:MAG TPA: hypothetical protein VMS02_03970 [Solirubrobacteraceae bacterium]|nr:hypothetical protein [Solirubrobacteraceae bacterium]